MELHTSKKIRQKWTLEKLSPGVGGVVSGAITGEAWVDFFSRRKFSLLFVIRWKVSPSNPFRIPQPSYVGKFQTFPWEIILINRIKLWVLKFYSLSILYKSYVKISFLTKIFWLTSKKLGLWKMDYTVDVEIYID